ncbi:MAG: aspartate-semialdehyde dehydrogenase [Chloroflexota bacterium]
MTPLNVAILGATGLVGQEFLKILEERSFPVRSLKLLASDRSAGRVMEFRGESFSVEETTDRSFDGVDLALFSAGADISRRFAPIAAAAGAVVVDNSAAWRMEPDIPLVVPEVNPDDAFKHQGIIANPNCSTIQMVVALAPLHRVNPLQRVIVDTYQSVSGTGGSAVDELMEQSRAVLDGRTAQPAVYPHQIAFNVLPHIDVLMDDGYYKEEWKMIHETRKIMSLPNLAVSATCVRVPVPISHSEAVHAEFSRPMSVVEARAILSESPGIVVSDRPEDAVYPLPHDAAGTDDVFVGRIRQDASHPNGLVMWVVADNLRKGAALNTIQIAELIFSRTTETSA